MRERILKKVLSSFMAIMLCIGSVIPMMSKVYAAENITVTYNGVVFSYNSSGGRPAENMHGIFSSSTGNIAYCGEHGIPTPMGERKGASVSLPATEIGNDQIRKILYYGYGGVEQWSGFSDSTYNGVYQLFSGNDSTSKTQSAGISITAMALTEAYGGNGRVYDVSGLSAFKSYIASKSAPASNFTVYRLSSGSSATQDIFTYRFVPNGTLKLVKTAASNTHLTALCPENYSIAGAQYSVYANEALTNLAGTLTTDASGNTNALTLNAGTYYVKESKAPKGYELDTRVHRVVVTAGSEARLNVTDEPMFDPLSLRIRKQADEKADKNLSVEGAEYTVKYYKEYFTTEEEGKSLNPLRTWVFRTDKNGYITLADKWKVGGDEFFLNDNGIPVGLFGTYTFEESKAPKGFAKTEGILSIQQVKQGEQSNQVNILKDVVDTEKEQTVSLTINKKDSETLEAKPQGFGSLAGAIYTVEFWDALTSEFLKVAEIVTNEQGIAKYENGKAGLYRVTETKASRGYLIDKAVKEVKAGIKEINTANFNYDVESLEQVTTTELSKKDATTGKELPGAKIQVKELDGSVVDEWISSDTPHIIKGLEPGKEYIMHEEIHPEGYLLAEDVKFTVKEDGSVTKVEMFDDYTKLDLSKQDITTSKEIPGAKMQIKDADGNITDEWISTDKPHRVEKIKPGKYTLHEEFAPDGYLVAEDVEFEVKSTGEVQKVVMKDDYTKTRIEKIDEETGKQLAGANLQIIDEDGKVVYEFTSKEKAEEVNRLKPGKYTLKETKAPKGYHLAEDIAFEVEAKADVKVITMKDKMKVGKITITYNPKLKERVVRTGDYVDISILLLISAASLAGASLLLKRKKK